MKELKDKITDILIEHAVTECPHCGCSMDGVDLEVEDLIIKTIMEEFKK